MKEFFEGLGDLYTKEFELAAIWLERPLLTATERTVRIAPGHLVAVEDGKLVDVFIKPTHKVIGCYGTIANTSLSFILIDIENNQPLTLKIK
jgi:hypothetical protein